MKVRIKEQSLFAKAAARVLRCKTVAVVWGSTIHLWNVNRLDFLNQTPWVVHEIAHVRQFRRHGLLRFSILYLVESARRGYINNQYEVEAREAEREIPDLEDIEFI